MGGSIGEHVWRQSYKMSTSKVTNGANLKKCQLLISTSTVILARILQSVNFLIYRYILGNTNTGVCSDIGNTNTSIHPVSYCPIWEEAVLIPDLNACLPARLASFRHLHMWALPRILAERYHHTVRVQTCSHACDLSSTCAHVPAGLLHLHALSLRFHSARVHTHATCARWLENSPLTIACRASPMPGRCVHACLARLLMSSLSCIPAFSPNVVCVQDSSFCAILHVINLYKWCKN